MPELSILFLVICAFSLIGVQKCHGVMNVPLQDSIIVSAPTPFDDNENVNYAVIPKLAQYYKDKNLKVIYEDIHWSISASSKDFQRIGRMRSVSKDFNSIHLFRNIVAGYYGGMASLPLAERKRLVEVWEEQANSLGFDLIVEVGAMPFVDTLEMARHCSKLNVTAITAAAEVIYQPTTLAELLEDLQRICDAARNLPLVYHQLIVVNQNIRTDQIFLGAMGGCVSCFVGVITSINTFLDIKASVDSIDGYQLWDYGMAAIAAAIKVGMNATEVINLFPDLAWKIKDAVNNCQLEQAADLQQELNRRMYAITNINGGVVDQTTRTYYEQEKAAFQLLTGIDVGYRYPLERPNSTVIDQMRSNLQGLGVRLYSSDSKN